MAQINSNNQDHRILFLDQIKAIMIALVIATHTALLGRLASTGVDKIIQSAPIFVSLNLWFTWVCNTFYMNILFLISGYLLPSSINRRGLGNFFFKRLIRLGIPLTAAVFLINNLLPLAGLLVPDSPAFGQSLDTLPLYRIGPQWFLLVLISFNAIYCLWAWLRKSNFSTDRKQSVPGWRSWLISAAILGVIEAIMGSNTEFWTRLKDTNLDGLGYQGMHLWTYAFLFALGCKAASHHWLERINKHLAVRWFQGSLLASFAVLALMLTSADGGSHEGLLNQAWPVLSFLIPFIGWGYIAIFLHWKQHHESIGGTWLAKAGGDSFGAYLIHMPILYIAIMSIYLLGLKDIWLLSLSATFLAIILSFWGSHLLRSVSLIRRII